MLLYGEDIGDFFLSAFLGFSIFLQQARSFDNENYKGAGVLTGAGLPPSLHPHIEPCGIWFR